MKRAAWALSFLSLIVTAIVIRFLPTEVPTHYTAGGEADGSGSRYLYLLIPVIILLTTAFLQFLGARLSAGARDDKQQAEAASNRRVMDRVSLCMAAVLSGSLYWALFEAWRAAKGGASRLDIDSLNITSLLCGVMLILAGNILPKTKRNGAVGLRVSWSMYNDNTWRRSNRFGGLALVLAGALSIVTAALMKGIGSVVMLLVWLGAATAAALVYAHRVYTEELSAEGKGPKNVNNL